jgi:8-oxo-dGTP pyrophosphatase MutT (NUDIX family)
MADEPGGAAAPSGDGAKRRRRRRRPKTGAARGGAAAAVKADGAATTRSAGGASGTAARRRSRKRTATTSQAAGASKTSTRKASATRKRPRRRTSVRRTAPGAKTKREISAGGVVYRRQDDGIEVVLASRRTRRGDLAWGLAKGGIEDGESMEDAAVREVREETGLRAEIETSLGETRYFYVWEDVRIRKTVHFFLMRSVGGDLDDRDDEMEEVRWFPLERALKRAAYRGERDVLQRAAELLR